MSPHLLALSTFVLTALASSPHQSYFAKPIKLSPPQENAPQIFNALHSAVRQWGSSLKHNGMSFFPASVPNNTQFYHGTQQAEPISGMEWLAFEIEHAEVFAHPRGPGRRPGGKYPGPPPGGEPGNGPPPPPYMTDFTGRKGKNGRKPPSSMGGHSALEGGPWERHPKEGVESMTEEQNQTGYLHLYRTTRTLSNLLYIDGLSAGKTSMGTLDSQDLILRDPSSADARQSAPWSDEQRAIDLCALGKEHGIEGFIRMEMGFELILCNFTDGLQFVSATQRPKADIAEGENDLSRFEYTRGVAMRYQGITAGRLNVDFSSMVSAYFYDIDLRNPDAGKAGLPRLPAKNVEMLETIKNDTLKVYKESKLSDHEIIDWQGVVDMIVTRYSDRLQFLNGHDSSEKIMLQEVNFLLDVFIDYPADNITASIEKCSAHYLNTVVPQTSQDMLIQEALLTVTHNICSTLFEMRNILSARRTELAASQAKTLMHDLVAFLDWSTWLECGKCAYDEVCFVAIWPQGRLEDHEHPSCVKNDDTVRRGGYWGRGGPGGPRQEKEDL